MTKEEFERKAHQAIDDFSNKIDELNQKSKDLSADLKQEYDEKIARLHQERDELRTRMDNFNADAQVTWDDAKDDFAHALENLKSGFRKLTGLFD